MITIITTEDDSSTNGVIDWLRFFNEDYIRINTEDYVDNLIIKLDNLNIGVLLDSVAVGKSDIVWYRRGEINFRVPTKKVEDVFKINGKIAQHLNDELSKIRDFVIERFGYANKCIGNYKPAMTINKLHVLELAKANNLKIPPTIITNRRVDVELFLRKHGAIITKAISEAPLFFVDEVEAYFYTAEVKDISVLPETFFPSLFQKKIEKAFEVRVFFVNNKYYSMAIFSQNDNSTSIDFRNYNRKKPNRNVPYMLPRVVKTRIKELMKDLKLNTGSIDLLVDKNNDYYFLEVNPVGQYGMVSYPCNYNLDRVIAMELVKGKCNKYD